MNHKFHECADPTCFVCNGSLVMCETCRGAEATLPTDCPGVAMTHEQREAVKNRQNNYIDGAWVAL